MVCARVDMDWPSRYPYYSKQMLSQDDQGADDNEGDAAGENDASA